MPPQDGGRRSAWIANGQIIHSDGTIRVSVAFSHFEPRPHELDGDKRQLKAQDVTAKLVRFDILRMVPKKNDFVLC